MRLSQPTCATCADELPDRLIRCPKGHEMSINQPDCVACGPRDAPKQAKPRRIKETRAKTPPGQQRSMSSPPISPHEHKKASTSKGTGDGKGASGGKK